MLLMFDFIFFNIFNQVVFLLVIELCEFFINLRKLPFYLSLKLQIFSIFVILFYFVYTIGYVELPNFHIIKLIKVLPF